MRNLRILWHIRITFYNQKTAHWHSIKKNSSPNYGLNSTSDDSWRNQMWPQSKEHCHSEKRAGQLRPSITRLKIPQDIWSMRSRKATSILWKNIPKGTNDTQLFLFWPVTKTKQIWLWMLKYTFHLACFCVYNEHLGEKAPGWWPQVLEELIKLKWFKFAKISSK